MFCQFLGNLRQWKTIAYLLLKKNIDSILKSPNKLSMGS